MPSLFWRQNGFCGLLWKGSGVSQLGQGFVSLLLGQGKTSLTTTRAIPLKPDAQDHNHIWMQSLAYAFLRGIPILLVCSTFRDIRLSLSIGLF